MTIALPERTAPAARPGGALAIRPDQTNWTPEQAAVLRQSGIKDQVTAAELSGFLHLCQRTGLDPFSRQIYLIGRWSKKDGRDIYTPQTGIDGYRVIAQRVTAQTGGTYGYEDTLWCDPSGRWRDVWLADAPPAAAKVTVIRNGQRFSAVARFSEYVQTFPDGNPKGLWAKMPAGQIAKCAEALALRKAFPHDLAGVYTAEEMAQADNVEPEQPRRSQRAEPGPWEQQAPPQQEPQQQAAPAGPSRDYLAEVVATDDEDALNGIIRDAREAGAPPHYLSALDDIREAHAAPDAAAVRKLYDALKEAQAPADHLARIAAIGGKKPGAKKPPQQGEGEQQARGPIADMPRRAMEWTRSVPAPAGPAPYSMSDAVAAEGAIVNAPPRDVEYVTDAAGEASWQGEPARQEHAAALGEMYDAARTAGLTRDEANEAFAAAHQTTPQAATVAQPRAQRDDLLDAARGAAA